MRTLTLLWMIMILAACTPDTAPPAVDLPTVAVLPSVTPTVPDAAPATEPAVAVAVSITAQAMQPTATATYTPTPITLTPTITFTPSVTITDTPTPTATITPSPTPRESPLLALAQAAAVATILPQELQPVTPLPPVGDMSIPNAPQLASACPTLPAGGFGTLFLANATLVSQLGCPTGVATNAPSALQTFESGSMVWLNGPIYVLYGNGRYEQQVDTFIEGADPASGGESPPPERYEPVRGFGKIWRTIPAVRQGLGWAITPEAGDTATYQRFDYGWMIWLPQRGDILVLAETPGAASGQWSAQPGSF